MSSESPDVQSVSRPQGQEIAHATPGSGPNVEVTGERRDPTRTKYLTFIPQNPRSKPRCALYCSILGIRAIASASSRSVPHIIFQATVRIVLTILVVVLAVALYWDVEAAFQDHLVGQ